MYYRWEYKVYIDANKCQCKGVLHIGSGELTTDGHQERETEYREDMERRVKTNVYVYI